MTSHTQCETEQTVLDLAYSLRSADVEKSHRSKKMNIVYITTISIFPELIPL